MAKMIIRQATLADVDAVTAIFITAMASNPSWNYRYPYRHEYPEDHLRTNRDVIRRFISPSYPDWTVNVVEVIGEGSAHVSKIVTISIWDLTYLVGIIFTVVRAAPLADLCYLRQLAGKDSADACGPGKDQNPVHVAAFFKALAECKKKHFDFFGSERLSLQILATLPEFRRHGYGTALVRWGMERAARDNVVLTLSASPQGSRLYTELGFRHLGNQVMQAPDEEEFLVISAMVYEPVAGAQEAREVP
ncbi:hypothetical protein Hte_002354 [Hypoxylon texense]